MNISELSRWFALIEAVELIASNCDDKSLDKYLKPCYIEKYVNTRCNDILSIINSKDPNVDAIKILDLNK